jgi:hypothetical protein
MNKRTVFLNPEVVAKALVNDTSISLEPGDLDAYGRIIMKFFPVINKTDVLENLETRMVKLPNRWTFILPRKDILAKHIRMIRDRVISENSREGVTRVRDKATGRMVKVFDFDKTVSSCNDYINNVLR